MLFPSTMVSTSINSSDTLDVDNINTRNDQISVQESETEIKILMEMGFSRLIAQTALDNTGTLEEAINVLVGDIG